MVGPGQWGPGLVLDGVTGNILGSDPRECRFEPCSSSVAVPRIADTPVQLVVGGGSRWRVLAHPASVILLSLSGLSAHGRIDPRRGGHYLIHLPT